MDIKDNRVWISLVNIFNLKMISGVASSDHPEVERSVAIL